MVTNAQRTALILAAIAVAATVVLPPWKYVDVSPSYVAGYSWVWSPIGRSPCTKTPTEGDLNYLRQHPEKEEKFTRYFGCSPDQVPDAIRLTDIAWNLLALEWAAILLVAGLAIVGFHRSPARYAVAKASQHSGPEIDRGASPTVAANVVSRKDKVRIDPGTKAIDGERDFKIGVANSGMPTSLTVFCFVAIGGVAQSALEITTLISAVTAKTGFDAMFYTAISADIAYISVALYFLRGALWHSPSVRRRGIVFLLGALSARLALVGALMWAAPALNTYSAEMAATGMVNSAAKSGLAWILWCALWLPYFVWSRRLRDVTALWAQGHAQRPSGPNTLSSDANA